MTPILVFSILVAYFLLLIGIMYYTSKGASNDTFFVGERKSPWYLVAFGMVGASLSGVTFVSVPGWVGNPDSQFAYMQMVLGYFVGYFVIAYVLMPIYYRMNLTSIYSYLGERFGIVTHKTGSIFFLFSRMIGAAIRLLLVANVLQLFVFDAWGIPFSVTVVFSIALIWLYTNKGGIKTIIYTDTLQTTFMIGAVLVTFYVVGKELNLFESGIVNVISESQYSKTFFFEDTNASNYFWKFFLGGIFITIGMTGLDQDMMQKNLTCKTLKDAQKNMISLAAILIFVNLLFLSLGALLYMYAENKGITSEISGDDLFATIALSSETGLLVGVLFLVGLIAAAYSSADGALTSLTTSVSHDIFDIESKPKEAQKPFRQKIHIIMSVIMILVILILKEFTNDNALNSIMFFAGFTYGPLIGIFFFGILTKRKLWDVSTPFICFVSVVITTLISGFSKGGFFMEDKKVPGIFGDYVIGHELIIINALITFGLIALVSFIFKNKTVL